MKCLACDFGGSSVKYALVDEQAQMEAAGKVEAPLDSIEQFIDTIEQLYNRFKDKITGIAISMPGYIDPDTGYLSDSGAYIPLYGHSILELLKDRCPLPITIENDGKCAALAEVWNGALHGSRDGAVIVLGSGIAGGIVKDGKIHGGRESAAGELSYMIIDPAEHNDLSCAYMSAAMHGLTYRICKAKNLSLSVQNSASILEEIDERVAMPYANPDSELKDIKADGVQIFKWLEEGDPDAKRIYQTFINSLAVVVHNLQICYAPEKIVIGGGLSLSDRILDDLNEELIRYYAGAGLGKQLQANVVRSRYLDECNLIGAAYNFMTRYT